MTKIDIVAWIHMWMFPSFHKAAIQRDNQFDELQRTLASTKLLNKEMVEKVQKYEDLLANRNAQATIAQSLVVTDHAVHRYRLRIGFTGTDEALKKMVYKLTIRHLSSMDKLPDGRYDLGKNVVAAVKGNTVTTIMKRGNK